MTRLVTVHPLLCTIVDKEVDWRIKQSLGVNTE